MNLDLDQLERLLSEATPGPWELKEKTYGKRGTYLIVADSKQNELATDEPWEHSMFDPKDTRLLVALRNAAPALIARVRELEEALVYVGNNLPK